MKRNLTIGALTAMVIGVGAALAAAADRPPNPAAASASGETALFAGGCFWSTEKAFEQMPGVLSAESGFAGGRVERPSYEQVLSGGTGHRETVKVVFDPARTSYRQLVRNFLRTIDPADAGGAFCDRGPQYRTGLFALTPQQRVIAAEELQRLEAMPKFRGRVAVQVLPAARFHAAEDYHQDFWRKNPLRYNGYRVGCGRDAALRAAWSGAGESPA